MNIKKKEFDPYIIQTSGIPLEFGYSFILSKDTFVRKRSPFPYLTSENTSFYINLKSLCVDSPMD